MSQQVRMLTVTGDEEGQRLDNYLMSRLKGVPKSAVYKVIRKGEVRVNKGRAKPERKLCQGDIVRIPPMRVAQAQELPVPSRSLAQLLDESILHDSAGLLVVNKPSGLAVHGGSGVSLGLIEALRQMPGNHGFLELIHRLDKDTSGCVMIARKRSVLKLFQDALRRRSSIQKRYLALAQGVWPTQGGVVDAPLLRYELANGERMVRVDREGKPSLTRFNVLKRYSDATFMEAFPITGRTHQIRVHARHMGCPLVGDRKYGDTPLNARLLGQGGERLFLHAGSLVVDLEGFDLNIHAELPEELQQLLGRLGVQA